MTPPTNIAGHAQAPHASGNVVEIAFDFASSSKLMLRSLASVLAQLEGLAASGDAAQRVIDLSDGMIARGDDGVINLCFDGDDLIAGETVHLSAPRAGPVEHIQIPPSDRYLRLVSAIASDRDTYSVRFIHGWPILSVDPSTTTAREAGGESIPAGGVAA